MIYGIRLGLVSLDKRERLSQFLGGRRSEIQAVAVIRDRVRMFPTLIKERTPVTSAELTSGGNLVA